MTEPATSSTLLRLLLVDPDERVRESLAGLLRIGRRCLVVARAGTPEEAIELAARHLPDVVVVDPRLPGMDDGTVLISRLRAASPASRVLVLNWSGAAEAEASGADAYTRKTYRPRELIDAVVSASRRSPA